MIGIPMGLLTANFIEWSFHKHVLHGLGKKRDSAWSFHWHEHHRNAHRYDHRDPTYERSLLGWHGQSKEALALAAGWVLTLPALPVAPLFTLTLWYSGINYYRKHKRAHRDTDWAREHLPWHYDHHMGPNPDANWCVTRPWFDDILGTREPYVGTARERADRARQAQRAEAAA